MAGQYAQLLLCFITFSLNIVMSSAGKCHFCAHTDTHTRTQATAITEKRMCTHAHDYKHAQTLIDTHRDSPRLVDPRRLSQTLTDTHIALIDTHLLSRQLTDTYNILFSALCSRQVSVLTGTSSSTSRFFSGIPISRFMQFFCDKYLSN